jgi:hypothetical protein
MRPGATTHTPGSGDSTTTPRAASVWIVISMCGWLGTRSPECLSTRPWSKRLAESSRPDTNWLELEASMTISPPPTRPVPCTVKGRAAAPSSAMSTPSRRRDEIVVVIGLRRAASSPSNTVGPSASAATGGMKRITVPARPQSTVVLPSSSSAGVMIQSSPNSPSPAMGSIVVPIDRRASTIRAVSRECSGARRVDGDSARAERTSSRLVRLFEPGRTTEATMGPAAFGDGHGASPGGTEETPGVSSS